MNECLDLRDQPDSKLALAALGALRELRPGSAVRLLTRDDPTLLLESLNMHLRDALRWELVPDGAHWAAIVRLAEDAASRDVLDTLRRDHRRLDGLLARALRRLNAGDIAGAQPLLRAFATGLRQHAHAENELLAPALGPQPAPEPLEMMLREHDELLTQLAAVEQGLAEGTEAWEIEPFVAILSGTLAKHEHREESHLFPLWEGRLARRARAERDALHEQVRALLES